MEALTCPIEWGAATFTLRGQAESGDRYTVAPFTTGVLVAAMDGLGHGAEAAFAAGLAVSVCEEHPHESVITLVSRCHERLRPTRGVVMSLASFNARDETMTWMGVGNVEGRLVRSRREAMPPVDRRHAERRTRQRPVEVERRVGERRQQPPSEFLLLRSGVVGSHLPPLYAAVLPVLPGDTLVFATDGVGLPPLEDAIVGDSPQAIAERVLSRHKKETDDALVLVARWVGLSQ